jgi:hypothetical protein
VAFLQNLLLPIGFMFLLLFPFRWRAIRGNGLSGRSPDEESCGGSAQQSNGKQKHGTGKSIHQDSPPLLATCRSWSIILPSGCLAFLQTLCHEKKGDALPSAPPLLIPPGRERVKKWFISAAANVILKWEWIANSTHQQVALIFGPLNFKHVHRNVVWQVQVRECE